MRVYKTWNDFSEVQQTKIHRLITVKTLGLRSDREEVRQECWLAVLQNIHKFDETRAKSVVTYFKFIVLGAISTYLDKSVKQGFTFTKGQWRGGYRSKRKDPRNQIPIGGTTRRPRPAGSVIDYTDYADKITHPGEACRRNHNSAEY